MFTDLVRTPYADCCLLPALILLPAAADFDWPRYKYVVQVVLGELRGEGVKMGCRNFWDPNTDSYAQEVYMNESLFCVAAVFGLYLY